MIEVNASIRKRIAFKGDTFGRLPGPGISGIAEARGRDASPVGMGLTRLGHDGDA